MSLFQFKEFSINQEGASMKVGTDSMILGAFIDSEQKNRTRYWDWYRSIILNGRSKKQTLSSSCDLY